MIIFLIGFMGSGKTTVGKKLANRLQYAFVDMDQFIQEKEGRTIEELFEKEGEDFFRTLESKYLRSLPAGPAGLVVATGGGLPCHDENMRYMIENGLTVYLQLNPGQLYHRLKHAKYKRPLLKDKNEEEVMRYIKQKLEERAPYYNQAQLTYDASNLKIPELIERIKEVLGD